MKEIAKNYTFRVIIEPESPKGFHGFVPLLRGLHTFGDSVEEVKRNLREAITFYLQGLAKDKESILGWVFGNIIVREVTLSSSILMAVG